MDHVLQLVLVALVVLQVFDCRATDTTEATTAIPTVPTEAASTAETTGNNTMDDAPDYIYDLWDAMFNTTDDLGDEARNLFMQEGSNLLANIITLLKEKKQNFLTLYELKYGCRFFERKCIDIKSLPERFYADAITYCYRSESILFVPQTPPEHMLFSEFKVKEIWVDIQRPPNSEKVMYDRANKPIREVFHINRSDEVEEFFTGERPGYVAVTRPDRYDPQKCFKLQLSFDIYKSPILSQTDCKAKHSFACEANNLDLKHLLATLDGWDANLQRANIITKQFLKNNEKYKLCNTLPSDDVTLDYEGENYYDLLFSIVLHPNIFLFPCPGGISTPNLTPFNPVNFWSITLADLTLAICTMLMLLVNIIILCLKLSTHKERKKVKKAKSKTTPSQRRNRSNDEEQEEELQPKKIRFLGLGKSTGRAPEPSSSDSSDSEDPPELRV